MEVPSSTQVLRLYRQLIRYGQKLQYTDKNYYYKRVIAEFKRNRDLQEPKEIKFQFDKGQSLLKRKSVI